MVATAPVFAYERPSPQELDRMIERYAERYGVPLSLVRRVVRAESNFNPGARNGPYWGLMQIKVSTARGLGYRGTGPGLLDAETNLNYAVAYLANAYVVGGHVEAQGHRLYRTGYYYEAKRKRLLAKLIDTVPKSETEVMVASAAPVPTLALAPEPENAQQAIASVVEPRAAAPRVMAPAPLPSPNPMREAAPEPQKPIVAHPQVVLASVLPVPSKFIAAAPAATVAPLALVEPERKPQAPMPKPIAKPELADQAEPEAKPVLVAAAAEAPGLKPSLAVGTDTPAGDVPLPRPFPKLAVALDEAVARYLAKMPPLPRPRAARPYLSAQAD